MNKNIIRILLVFVLLIPTSCQSNFEEVDLESNKIAFISSRNRKLEVFSVNVEGNNLKKIIDVENQVVDIEINPNLRYVILEDAMKKGQDLQAGGLYIYDLKKREKKLIDNNGGIPIWSPDGKRFIYERFNKDYSRSIVLSDSFLKNRTKLSTGGKYNTKMGMSWSPDSKELLFLPYVSNFMKKKIDTLYRYIIEENETKEIKLERPYSIYNLAWSPRERIIAAGIYNHNQESFALALINPDTGEVTQLKTIKNNFYTNLEWSTDGKYILFSVIYKKLLEFDGTWPWGDGNVDIFVYDIENDKLSNVSNSKFTDYQPEWIP